MESPSLCDRPKFMRQGTFDVRREDRLTRTPFSGSKSSCLAESPLGSATDISIGDKSNAAPQRQLVRSATMNQPRLKNSRPMLTKNNTSTCLFSGKPSNWLEARKNNRELLLSKIRDPQNSLDTFTNYASSRHNNSTINELTTTSLADDVAAKVSAASIPSKFLKISSRLFKKLKN
ncbi:hypothetical protein KR044_011279 [Drosophila immigrans]|nr:hypothetical protein KR044_011279 [Drosophila immigrans]